MGVLRWPVACVCALLCAFGATPAGRAASDPYAAFLAPSGTCGAAADQLGLDPAAAQVAMQCLTNYARAHAKLGPLALNTTLGAAGQAKLKADLSCGEFSHTPCGTPFDSVFAPYVQGATSYAIGENIAWSTGSYGTPRATMDAWLNSDGHRENILNAEFTEVGVGYLSGQTFQGYDGATLWSQEFGVRTPGSTAQAQPPAVRPVAVTKKKKSVRHRSSSHRRA